MKNLQNNFTNPEQSKRLLELGLPADSADCYYRDFASSKVRLIPNVREMDDKLGIDTNFLIPCWSVGRLIEILTLCVTDPLAYIDILENLMIYDDNLQTLVQAFSEQQKVIDFSKLED